MLIPIENLKLHSKVTGILHVGAHACEEKQDYMQHFQLHEKDIIWVDAMESSVESARLANPNSIIIQACISNSSDESVTFIVTDNGASSSLFELGTHSELYPNIREINRCEMKTTTIDHLMESNKFENTHLVNFLALDIQGAELLALQGAETLLKQIEYVYLEVNVEYVYKNCALLSEINSFLNARGFERQSIQMSAFGWGDAFYVRKK